jgi:superoxide reductase
MTNVGQIYYCMHCHNTVLVVGEGEGVLVCCGAKMRLLEDHKSFDHGEAWEYHIPRVVQTENGITVLIGEKSHPMDEHHFISWIEIQTNTISLQYSLDPLKDAQAQAHFPIKMAADSTIKVRLVCNVHGLWSN